MRPEDVPQDITFSTTIPGGHAEFSCKLARRPSRAYQDLERLTDLTVYGAGGRIAWQGRLERAPRDDSGGDVGVNPSGAGYQASLDDDRSIRYIYVDQDKTRWIVPSVQRRIDQDAFGRMVQEGTTTQDETSGEPSVELTFGGGDNWDAAHYPQPEMWYDAGPGGVGTVYYALKFLADYTGDPAYFAAVRLSTTDFPAPFADDDSGNLVSAAPTSGSIDATQYRRFAHLEFSFGDAGGGGAQFSAFFTALGVYGPHGIIRRGAGSATDVPALLDVDIIAHLISTFTGLRVTHAGQSTIVAAPFEVTQAAYPDVTTAGEILKDVNRFSLNDWAVWDNREFWLYNRGGGPSKRWRARSGEAQLSETGPQVERLWDSIVVQYTDTAGITRTVGPPGSGTDTEDASLADSDPYNPAVLAGTRRRDVLVMNGVSTPSRAITAGQAFLKLSKELDTSGQANLIGYVLDDRGVIHPAWAARAGDYISFVDSNDTSYRRISQTSYSDSSKTNSISLDAPPEGLQALLERLSASILPLGLT